MKKCVNCKEEKEEEEFYRLATAKDGLQSYCKSCVKARAKKWQKENPQRFRASVGRWQRENPERFRASVKKWQKENSSKFRATVKRWQEKNPDKLLANVKKWQKENPHKLVANNIKYQLTKERAMSKWADQSLIEDIYKEAKDLTELTGIQFHVDHIIPLRGKKVSGLHVESNLQIMTAKENVKKNNQYVVE